jgi:hypothetical protein
MRAWNARRPADGRFSMPAPAMKAQGEEVVREAGSDRLAAMLLRYGKVTVHSCSSH